MIPFIKSFLHAGRGIAASLKKQRNIKIMLAAGAAATAWAAFLRLPVLETSVIVLTGVVVIGLEMLNTAGEKLIDLLSPQYDTKYGTIKDILAGAVLTAAAGAVIVGLLILWKPSINFLASVLGR